MAVISDDQQLLDANEIRQKIEKLLVGDVAPIFLSAFFSRPAFTWVSKLVGLSAVKLVIRATPYDFLSGASDLGAVRDAIKAGWNVRFISVLHAKVYLIGDTLFVGSGNLTAKGMALLRGGNLEFSTILRATKEARKIVMQVFDQAQPFTNELLDGMEEFIAGNTSEIAEAHWWPAEVVLLAERDLYCNDFPHGPPSLQNDKLQDPWSTLQGLLHQEDYLKATGLLKTTMAFHWLRNTISDAEGSLHFGGLTAALHDVLADDPAPYRSSVKDLLANLLKFIELTPKIGIEISRPRHSQVIRLV